MYHYSDLRPQVFTDTGQRAFLKIRDRANALLKEAGAARLQEIINSSSGDSWLLIACVDRLVELGEIREVAQDDVVTQYRIFVKS